MPASPFALLGDLLANSAGVLLLWLLAASSVLVWNWRWAVTSTVSLLLVTSSLLSALHSPLALVTASQWLAALLAGLLLWQAGSFSPIPTAPAGNWLIRLCGLGFLLAAWQAVSPSISLPLLTQAETDLLCWIGLCGLVLLSLSNAPVQTGSGLLLLTAPLQSLAALLAPASGAAVLVGMAQILLALACAGRALAQQLPPASPQPPHLSLPATQRPAPRWLLSQPSTVSPAAPPAGPSAQRRSPLPPAPKTEQQP